MARRIRPKIDAATQALLDRAKDFEAVSLHPGSVTLPRQADIQVTRSGAKRDDRKVEGDQARRLDAFAALKATLPAGAFDSARRLETDILIRRGENDKGQATSRVDRTAGLTTDAMIDAARSIEAVESRLQPRDWWLLMELICPTVDRDGLEPRKALPDGKIEYGAPLHGWRAHVYYITNERHSEGQSAAVRAACTNLRDAYTAADRDVADKKRRAA